MKTLTGTSRHDWLNPKRFIANLVNVLKSQHVIALRSSKANLRQAKLTRLPAYQNGISRAVLHGLEHTHAARLLGTI